MTDTIVNNLVINKLTRAQYDQIENPSDTELYLIPDEIDDTPTSGSDNLITSDGVYNAISNKVDKVGSSTDNAVVRFDGTSGNIQNSGVTINDSDHVTAVKFIKSGGTSSQFLKADGSVDSTSYGTYSKPSGGIPKTDLASAVQTSLGKADTALQSFTETDPTVPSWAKASTKPTYTASEVGALPATTSIPSKTSDLTNDSNFPSDANYVHTDNNYTTTEKNKLNGIAAGAEVNQNAFSNVKVGSTTIAADSKTDTLELVAGSNITLTPDATNDKVTIAATDTTYSAATTSAAGLMSAADKTKLDGIAAGAQVNIVTSVDTTATAGVNLSLTSGKLDVTVSGGSIASGNGNVVTGGTVYAVTSTLAPKASPALTGTPTAPTAAAGTNTTQIATTAFVKNAVDSKTHYIANLQSGDAANYITEPEVKEVKINGSTSNVASSSNCVLQYDTINKCLKFIFN